MEDNTHYDGMADVDDDKIVTSQNLEQTTWDEGNRIEPSHLKIVGTRNNKSPKDEIFEKVKNYVGDRGLHKLNLPQFLQPHISNPRAVAKYIDRLEA